MSFYLLRKHGSRFWLGALGLMVLGGLPVDLPAGETLMLHQPTFNRQHLVFAYGGDLWRSDLQGRNVYRLTSTPAVEKDPHLSPDGHLLAFTSNRCGVDTVYVMPVEGGDPLRLTWYPAPSRARGWTPDGKRVLYASSRATAPTRFDRLWTVSPEGGPSALLSAQWGTDASFSPDGRALAVDRVARWDVEWRGYRGGQNTPLSLLNLDTLEETLLPCERSTDIAPVWLGDTVYFLSDRQGVSNIWAYGVGDKSLTELTRFEGSDIKSLAGFEQTLMFERDGRLHTLDLGTLKSRPLGIEVVGDFPWVEPRWEDVTERMTAISLSPTGKRLLMEARGDIFTVPLEHGDARNLSASSGAADRAPVWSPRGDLIAWFSDAGKQPYHLVVVPQKGDGPSRTISLGESKMAWEPAWSPDGGYIAFVDDDVRIRVVDLKDGSVRTADVGGSNLERGDNGLVWSSDSRWLAYTRTGANHLRRVMVWDRQSDAVHPLTDPMADAFAPVWDHDGQHLYFLASTDVALGSGWANTSSMQAEPRYGVYLVNLGAQTASPFELRSDEEAKASPVPASSEKEGGKKGKKGETKDAGPRPVRLDWPGLERRILPLTLPVGAYRGLLAGPEGSVLVAENVPRGRTLRLQKYVLEKREAEVLVEGISSVVVSADGKTMAFRRGRQWFSAGTAAPVRDGGKAISMTLSMKVDRLEEWAQMFEEAWRYQRDYFYDPGMHGRNWNDVHNRYAPLLPHVRHRADLNTLLDWTNGELSVGHSFVFGGDMPAVDSSRVGLLGVDWEAREGRWAIGRIYTRESWNPDLAGPLDEPGLKVATGQYLVGVNGKELTVQDDPYRFFDGTAGAQTVLHLNTVPRFEGAWTIRVKPVESEQALRQRAWVEDNRRLVDKLSGGKLAYVWVPNTSGQGFVSFNRYYFAQQDREGAVIYERFNGGGLLDDYMVDLMTRTLRAALTNEVPGGKPFRLPAGILGPKALLINEVAGSGGDFFPWVFRHQQAGPLIGQRTWGGLVKSSVHYPLIDGGALTAPDNAVFDPRARAWVAENEGVPPDIEVRQDARSLQEGRDPQLERAVQEVMSLLKTRGLPEIVPPPFPRPAVSPSRKAD